MTLVRVEEIPVDDIHNKVSNNVIDVFDRFLESDMRCARVVWEPYGYSNIESALAALYQTRRRQNYPVRIVRRNGEFYIAKKEV